MSILEPSSTTVRELSPSYDPWDPITSLRKHGRHVLTSVEMTVTNLCNMRCEHCAVGDSLTMKEGEMLPLKNMLDRPAGRTSANDQYYRRGADVPRIDGREYHRTAAEICP